MGTLGGKGLILFVLTKLEVRRMQVGISRACSIVFIKHLLTIVSIAIVSVAIALLMTLRTATVNTEECDSTFILLTTNF